jgi:hypothetical protein
MKRFARGSEWRKWDLHVHPPGTKLSDGYGLSDGKPNWDRFCQVIHGSDVQAIGIADYFSLDGFFAFKENYDRLYPHSEKVFFPNLELRLNEAVNRATEVVDFHVIFPPDLSREKATEFLGGLKTQNTDENGKKQSCAQLKTHDDFEKATISREDIESAVKHFVGKKAVTTDYFLLIAAVNSCGIRADTSSKRKMNLADEIDKCADGFFGNPMNTDYYLNPKRLEAPDQRIAPKPVFAGCDAHSFDDLEAWLGTEVTGSNKKHVTWVKADLTFEGLQQTLIEPSERVRIQATAPDKKEPYKVISRITFTDSSDFPSEVVFNPGLNAIIGSRSSGKSALLAYVAHAVDPGYAVRQQVAATGMDESDVGPGASVTWADVRNIKYAVEWAASMATTGQVIYIPQNSLYAISERPDDITAKIQPTVFRYDPDFEAKFCRTETDVEGRNESIRDAVTDWFSLAAEIRTLTEEIRGLGDREAITQRQTELTEQIKTLRESSALTVEEVERYQQVVGDIGKNDTRLKEIEREQRDLGPYVVPCAEEGMYEATDQVAVTISMTPAPAIMPSALQIKLQTLLDAAQEPLLDSVKSGLAVYRVALDTEQREMTEANEKLRSDNKELIEKNVANVQIAALVEDLKDQKETLAEIDKKAALSKKKKDEQRKLLTSIDVHIKARDLLLKSLADDFNAAHYTLDDITFTIEVDFDPEDLDRISIGFNKHEISPYIVSQKRVDLGKVLSESGKFVEYMGAGKQKLKQGEHAATLVKTVLTATRDVRFVASLEGDRIGGFRRSSMTPGKQALFALTLILAESGEPWPLLIDQPEDDLDSRSVCETIVKDLMRRKRERQVIMVSHDANLVIGADSEEILVANRHGDDRRNKDDKMFSYLTGSLEHSKPKDPKVKLVLDSAGIREHACEILDGGAEAFQKRKDKYRI